jgi:tetratricopeptide (TPR) repeat protein
MSELTERLQRALGTTYRIERELPGGGMSRVFLATEVQLARKVVVKVLPPEMAAAVQSERFAREIQVAASLQHPHIVPLLTAGSAEDLAWYVMPYIEGESLASKIAREGALPVNDALRILRDIVDALAYSHGRGVVHRDIKPDNVMLSGRHALVTDFGVAKAVSASSGGRGALTTGGVALGTPTYMAPEQAAADPNIDHRADLYAVGVLAYEMLTGRTPFVTATPQAMLAAHVTAYPDQITLHRPSLQPMLAAAVMRCLEKHPADRWQSSAELAAVIDTAATPSGGLTPVPTSPHAAIQAEADRQLEQAHPFRVALLFAVATVIVVATIFAATRVFGLPDWVWIGSAGLMALGFPIVMYTGRVERKRARVMQTGALRFTDPPAHHEWFTWKRAILGGALAITALLVATVGYAVARTYGIGSAATLLSSGAISSGDRFVLADFQNRTADSTLGTSVTEALRVDLGQSSVVKMMSDREVAQALTRMRMASGTALTDSLAQVLAMREGAKAVIVGEVSTLGTGFVLTAKVIEASSGETRASVRATAADAGQLLSALNDLSGQLRERVGESLRAIRASDPLDQVTTASLDALQHYSLGSRIFVTGDMEGAVDHLRMAITIDSQFAMAWRKMASALGNLNAPPSQVKEATRRAFQLRDRLTPLERGLVAGVYYRNVEPDLPRSVEAYQEVLRLDSFDVTAANNLGLVLNQLERYTEAETVLRRQIAHGKAGGGSLYINLSGSLANQGRWEAIDSLADDALANGVGNPALALGIRATAASRSRNYARVDSLLRQTEGLQLFANQRDNRDFAVIDLRTATGKHEEALVLLDRKAAAKAADGDSGTALDLATSRAWEILLLGGDTAQARRELAAALRKYPWERINPEDRPYGNLAGMYAWLRDVPAMQRMRREWEATVPAGERAKGLVAWWDSREALARGDLAGTIAKMREQRALAPCQRCGLYEEARYWEALGHPDSAEAVLTRAVTTIPSLKDETDDIFYFVPTLNRLGEMAEGRGDKVAARDYYQRFVDYWRDADPQFQPRVAEAKRRLAALGTDTPRP